MYYNIEMRVMRGVRSETSIDNVIDGQIESENVIENREEIIEIQEGGMEEVIVDDSEERNEGSENVLSKRSRHPDGFYKENLNDDVFVAEGDSEREEDICMKLWSEFVGRDSGKLNELVTADAGEYAMHVQESIIGQASQYKVPKTYNQAVKSVETQRWREAMEKEYKSLMETKTWELVEFPAGVNVVGTKWVYAIKAHSDGTVAKFKARLVA